MRVGRAVAIDRGLKPSSDTTRSAGVTPLRAERPSDAVLVGRALDGDGFARELLFRSHAHEVTRVVMRLLGDRHEAEDVVQDTFVAAFAELDRLREAAAFRSWLVRMAVHQVHRRFRRRRLRRALGLEGPNPELALQNLVSDDASPELRAELAGLWAALERLPARRRTAWFLRNVEGYSLEETASACDCSLATAKRYIQSAEERIRSWTQQDGGRSRSE